MIFEIEGEVTPYTRMTQRSKWNARSRKYLDSKAGIQLIIKNQMQMQGWERLPDKTPFVLDVTFTRRNLLTCDLDNLVKAVLDAMNGIVFDDDRYCIEIMARKFRAEEWEQDKTDAVFRRR